MNLDEDRLTQTRTQAFRDRLVIEWNKTQQRQTFADQKRVYYLSLEFLMGRALDNAMLNVGMKDVAKAGMKDLGFRIEDVISQEHDAALGNGGLGRLAACFLDSMATMNYPAWGYGLRYRYGIFKQEIVDGYQVEIPDYWLDFNPWEFPRHDITVDVQFYGYVSKHQSVAPQYHKDPTANRILEMKMARQWRSGKAARLSMLWPSTFQSQVMLPLPQTTSVFGHPKPRRASLTFKDSILATTRALSEINNAQRPFPPSCILMIIWTKVRSYV